jgi:hypothetical protein
MAAMALAVASVASAAPTVSMVWTGCAGFGCGAGVGTSNIVANVGDTLTLDILVTGDSNGVSFASLSYDIRASGVVSAYARFGIDSINDGLDQMWDFEGNYGHTLAPASATHTRGSHCALVYLAGSGVICPGPPAVGNASTGQCGQSATGILAEILNFPPGDLGNGVIGSFSAGPGLTFEPQFTLAQAQFEIACVGPPPCSLIIDINALRGSSGHVLSGQTKDITAKARIMKGTAPLDATVNDTTLTITSYVGPLQVDQKASGPLTLVVGKGGTGDTLTMDVPVCAPGQKIDYVAHFSGTASTNGELCEATSGRLRKTCK